VKLAEIKSRAELSKFIESYWHFDGSVESQFLLLPDGTFNVIISTAGFSVGNGSVQYPCGAYLVPIATKPLQINTEGNVFGIRFKAFSMVTVAGKKVNTLGLVNGLEDSLAKPFRLLDLGSKINRERELEQARVHLENLAFDLLNHRYFLNEGLRAQVNYLLDRKGDVRISSLCTDLGITRQGLHKSFIGSLGIGPKELAMTWRLNYFFTLMKPQNSLTGTALDAGFFDQAHSINSFKSQWCLSPSNLQKTNPAVFRFAQENMTRRFNNFYDPEI
jgi:AraC-like DNA-binding protein